MANVTPGPQPAGITPWVKDGGFPTTVFLLYMISLDQAVRNLTTGLLTQAANDAAAAAAGVPLDGLYRNGNAVQVRLT